MVHSGTKVCLWNDTFLSSWTLDHSLRLCGRNMRKLVTVGHQLSKDTVAERGALWRALLTLSKLFHIFLVFQNQEVKSQLEAQPLFFHLKRGRGHGGAWQGEKQGSAHKQAGRCLCSLALILSWRRIKKEFTQLVGFPTRIWMSQILHMGIWGS